ncbi:hypothetical protein D0T57_10495 [Dysgonomonas sp. 511]|nr:hypothetical protein [Dysgonomonas sp. 511]
MYSPEKGSGDPHGFVNLLVSPEHTYGIVFFGGAVVGTWKELDEYLILEPDTTYNDDFYMYALYNDVQKNISIQFDGFGDEDALYSFDDDAVMHPVFNENPNCFNYPYTKSVKKGAYKEIHLAIKADKSYGQKDASIEALVYTFALDAGYNDFKIVLNELKQEKMYPMLGVSKGNKLIIEHKAFAKRSSWDEISDDDKHGIRMLTSHIGKPIEGRPFGEMVDEMWIETFYPVVPYIRKEYKMVRSDTNNLFDAECKDR